LHGGAQVCQDRATWGCFAGVASATSCVREASSEGVVSSTGPRRHLIPVRRCARRLPISPMPLLPSVDRPKYRE
jgi:hypothetical protein